MSVTKACPSCGGRDLISFYSVDQVPVHSVLLMPTREIARSYPKGDIELGFCNTCAFISNLKFDPEKHDYSERYEETQGFSPTFRKFHDQLADDIIRKYDIRHKTVLEIGCGKGEFLALLCSAGNNRGIGFDPAFVPERNPAGAETEIEFIRDFYSERYSAYKGDFVCCKMTLEHIHDVAGFMATVRAAIGGQRETLVFFQVPNAVRILKDLAFWDIYYEHCSYFAPASLKRLFARSNFRVIDIETHYQDQYLATFAHPGTAEAESPTRDSAEIDDLRQSVQEFRAANDRATETWKCRVRHWKASGKKVVLWGSGSKAVAFLTSLGLNDEVEYVVDINPFRHDMYMAGSGQRIVAPEFLKQYRPDVVVVMNAIYRDEIQNVLESMDVADAMLVTM